MPARRRKPLARGEQAIVLIPEKDAIRRVRDLCRREISRRIGGRCSAVSPRRANTSAFACCNSSSIVRRRFASKAWPSGSTEESTVLLLPSLVIDKRTASRGLDILARSI